MSPDQVRDVQETVDEFVRTAPSLALLSVVWRRSFYDAKERKVA